MDNIRFIKYFITCDIIAKFWDLEINWYGHEISLLRFNCTTEKEVFMH